MHYIHQLADWPNFIWNYESLMIPLSEVRFQQGKLLGRLQDLGFELRNETSLENITWDVIKSSEIEGEMLPRLEVRSSLARKLGVAFDNLITPGKKVENTVELMLDATQNYLLPLSAERLNQWHRLLFSSEENLNAKIEVGRWRTDEKGPMQVVSGPMGKERIHFQAPPASKIEVEMIRFLSWVNNKSDIDPILKSGISHLWFLTIHPYDDGNGRIGRAIADMMLARADRTSQRFYSLSLQIQQERKGYYETLEKAQCGTLDITMWLHWYLRCLERALITSNSSLEKVLFKSNFWKNPGLTSLNHRQRLMLNKLMDRFEGKLTTSKWAKITKCSTDTALRDIQALVDINILAKEPGGGRSTSYCIAQLPP